MANAKVKVEDTLNLKTILVSEIKKTDDQKAMEAVEETLMVAQHRSGNELHEAKMATITMRKQLTATIKSPNSTLAAILQAQRNLDLTVANEEAMAEIMEARF